MSFQYYVHNLSGSGYMHIDRGDGIYNCLCSIGKEKSSFNKKQSCSIQVRQFPEYLRKCTNEHWKMKSWQFKKKQTIVTLVIVSDEVWMWQKFNFSE